MSFGLLRRYPVAVVLALLLTLTVLAPHIGIPLGLVTQIAIYGLYFHLFAVGTLALLFYGVWRLVHSPFGRVLQAIRDNETRVRFLGYSTCRYKLLAFIIMATLIGYGGALLSLLLQGVYANNLGWQRAGDALLMTILGGIPHFLGPLIGAASTTSSSSTSSPNTSTTGGWCSRR